MTKRLQIGIAVAGVLGAVAAFFPFVSGLGIELSLWDMKDASPDEFYPAMVGCIAGAVGAARAYVPVVGFAIAAFALRGWLLDLPDLAYGGLLMVAAVLLGLAASVAVLVQWVQRRADGKSASS